MKQWVRESVIVVMLISLPGYSFPSIRDVEKVCSGSEWSETCLKALILYRCVLYSSDLTHLNRCRKAVNGGIRRVDLNPVKGRPGEWVVFRNLFAHLVTLDSTREYLQNIKNQLEHGYRFKEPFSLWNQTLDYSNQYPSAALFLLGTLFQDTSDTQAHVGFLRVEEEGRIPEQTLELLSEVLDLLNPEQLGKGKHLSWLSLYPDLGRSHEKQLKPNPYHFYTIGLMAQQIKLSTRDTQMSFFVAFLVNTLYEFRNIFPGQWPIRDPAPFSPWNFRDSIQDIYAGYLGALWGIGYRGKPLSYWEFQTELTMRPEKLMIKLFRTHP